MRGREEKRRKKTYGSELAIEDEGVVGCVRRSGLLHWRAEYLGEILAKPKRGSTY